MRGIRRHIQTIGIALLACVVSLHVAAQGATAYPSKPIRIVVPFPPGAFNDTLGRLLAQRFQESWGQPALV